MKRLKLFKEAFNVEDYYFEVDSSIMENLFEIRAPFDEKVKRWLEKCGFERGFDDFVMYKIYEKKVKHGVTTVEVISLGDEWFLVREFYKEPLEHDYKITYWKCDQFEGLKKLLDDKYQWRG